jgi:hypothetical protein
LQKLQRKEEKLSSIYIKNPLENPVADIKVFC